MALSWLDIAKRLEAIAQTGLSFTDNVYDIDRYEEIRTISNEIFHNYTGEPIEKVRNFFINETFYPTPKVDVRGVVFRNDKILLVRERLDNHWSVPGGWADIGYSPNEIVVKEVKEESGIEVSPIRLLAIFDKKNHEHPPSPFHVYKIMILCNETGGELSSSIETDEAGFFELSKLPPLSLERITENQIHLIYKLYKNANLLPIID